MLTKEDLLAIGSLMDEKLDAKLKPIKADIAEMKSEIADMKGEIADMKGEIADMKSEIADMKGRLDRVEERLDRVESRLDRVEGRLDNVEDQLGQVNERTIQIETQTTRLGVIVENEVDKAVKTLGEGHDGIIEGLKRDFVTADELEKDRIRLFSLEEAVRKHTRQIENLQRRTG